MLQATIIYNLTEEAQRAQMAATGQPVARKQTATVEVKPEDLTFYPVESDGTITVNLYAGSGLPAELRNAGAITAYAETPDIPGILREFRAKKQALLDQISSRDQEVADAIMAGKHDSNDSNYAVRSALNMWSMPAALQPESAELRKLTPLAHAAAVRRQEVAAEEEKARRQREKEERERIAAEDARKEQEKLDYITAWIEEHGDTDLRLQHQNGMLCRKTALKLIADAAFIENELADAYRYPTCDDRGCPCGREELDCVPPEVYQGWPAILAALPEGTTARFIRVTECPGEDWDDGENDENLVKHYAAEIRMPVGPFVFDRTIQL